MAIKEATFLVLACVFLGRLLGRSLEFWKKKVKKKTIISQAISRMKNPNSMWKRWVSVEQVGENREKPAFFIGRRKVA